MPYEPTNPPCPKCTIKGDKFSELKDTGTKWYCYSCDNYFQKLPGRKAGYKLEYVKPSERKEQKEDEPGGIFKGKKLFGMNQPPGSNVIINDQIKLVVKHLGGIE